MVVFAIEFVDKKKGREYMKRVHERFNPKIIRSASELSTLFLKGRVASVQDFYVVEVSPTLPPFYLLPAIGIISLWLFNITAWYYYSFLGLLLCFQIVWYTGSFYLILLNIGSKKAGSGEVNRVSDSEALRRIAGWDNQKSINGL